MVLSPLKDKFSSVWHAIRKRRNRQKLSISKPFRKAVNAAFYRRLAYLFPQSNMEEEKVG